MPFLRLNCDAENSGYAFGNEIFGWKSQLDDIPAEIRRDSSNEGENSDLATFMSTYRNLPDHLRACLDYCCLIDFQIGKRKLVRLLLAEGLIQEKPGEIMEDVAAKYIQELVVFGMLREFNNGTCFVNHHYHSHRKLCIFEVEKHDFVTACANSSLRAMIRDDGKDNLPNYFKGLIIQSLFITTDYIKGLSGAYMKAICELKFLVVLDLEGKIEYLPDEVGDLVHLRYLGLFRSGLKELPLTIGKLQKLQTLDISFCCIQILNEIELLSIQQLRHLIMSNSIRNGEIRVPKDIGSLVNLHTCRGLYAGGGIANELGRLTQLRQLGVKRVSDDHATELAASIMKMVDLISLSLEADKTFSEHQYTRLNPYPSLEPFSGDTNIYTSLTLFPSLEPFSPPPLLQYLYLKGGLVEIPNWVASMENLTTLALSNSNLSENPTSVLQFLPKLKHLSLWEAYKAKRIGKEFCEVGGFAKLETLTISSYFLFEWTEIENGALPSLKQLKFYNCRKLMLLPEGLQNIFTLEYLSVYICHNDLQRRLNGAENYKIKHIPKVDIIPPDQETYPDR